MAAASFTVAGCVGTSPDFRDDKVEVVDKIVLLSRSFDTQEWSHYVFEGGKAEKSN